MLDYICITSIISTCQMALFMVIAIIVTYWSYSMSPSFNIDYQNMLCLLTE